MPEAVIVSTARSPIGRAFKGALANERPDDIAAQIVTADGRLRNVSAAKDEPLYWALRGGGGGNRQQAPECSERRDAFGHSGASSGGTRRRRVPAS